MKGREERGGEAGGETDDQEWGNLSYLWDRNAGKLSRDNTREVLSAVKELQKGMQKF